VADPPAHSRGRGRPPQPVESVQAEVIESEQIARTVTMTRTSRSQAAPHPPDRQIASFCLQRDQIAAETGFSRDSIWVALRRTSLQQIALD
jgi:hypothetical protein